MSLGQAMVVLNFTPSTQEAGTAWSTEQVSGQPGLYREKPCLEKEKKQLQTENTGSVCLSVCVCAYVYTAGVETRKIISSSILS